MSLTGGSTCKGEERAPRQLGWRRRLLVRTIIAVGTLLLARSFPATAHAQNEASWIGKRVVQTSSDLTLRDGDTAVVSEATVPLYRVEGTDGSWLWLRADPGDVEALGEGR